MYPIKLPSTKRNITCENSYTKKNYFLPHVRKKNSKIVLIINLRKQYNI